MQAPPPGRRASRHRRGFRSGGSPCADESTVALRLSTPAGELRIRVGQGSGMTLKSANAMSRTYLDSYVTALVRLWHGSCSAGGRRREPEDAAGDAGPRPGDRG